MKLISEQYHKSKDGLRKYKFVTLECPECGNRREYQAAGAKKKQYTECPDCRIKKEFTGTKICTKCNIEKDLNEFTSTRKMSDGKYARCRKCRSEDAKINNAKKSPEEKYGTFAARMYNITKEEAIKLRRESSSCGICKKEIKWKNRHLDHCHNSKKVRGILCPTCNKGLGSFYDNPTYLQNAIAWLAAHD